MVLLILIILIMVGSHERRSSNDFMDENEIQKEEKSIGSTTKKAREIHADVSSSNNVRPSPR
jgi:hypothetical protein